MKPRKNGRKSFSKFEPRFQYAFSQHGASINVPCLGVLFIFYSKVFGDKNGKNSGYFLWEAFFLRDFLFFFACQKVKMAFIFMAPDFLK
jgi:hypothetical protein